MSRTAIGATLLTGSRGTSYWFDYAWFCTKAGSDPVSATRSSSSLCGLWIRCTGASPTTFASVSVPAGVLMRLGSGISFRRRFSDRFRFVSFSLIEHPPVGSLMVFPVNTSHMPGSTARHSPNVSMLTMLQSSCREGDEPSRISRWARAGTVLSFRLERAPCGVRDVHTLDPETRKAR